MHYVSRFLANYRAATGARDGLPTHYHREVMAQSIRPGATVAIVTQHGQVRSGKAVMRCSAGGWVLNLGGAHGTPGIADARNTVFVSGVRLVGRDIVMRRHAAAN